MSATQYLTPTEVSDRYNGTPGVRTLANWRSAGNCGPPFIRICGRIMYPIDGIEEWERRNTHVSTKEYAKEPAAE